MEYPRLENNLKYMKKLNIKISKTTLKKMMEHFHVVPTLETIGKLESEKRGL